MAVFTKKFQQRREEVKPHLAMLEKTIELLVQDPSMPYERKLELEESYEEIQQGFYNINSIDGIDHLKQIADIYESPLIQIANEVKVIQREEISVHGNYQENLNSLKEIQKIAKYMLVSYNQNNGYARPAPLRKKPLSKN
jgi:hypothetical protein